MAYPFSNGNLNGISNQYIGYTVATPFNDPFSVNNDMNAMGMNMHSIPVSNINPMPNQIFTTAVATPICQPPSGYNQNHNYHHVQNNHHIPQYNNNLNNNNQIVMTPYNPNNISTLQQQQQQQYQPQQQPQQHAITTQPVLYNQPTNQPQQPQQQQTSFIPPPPTTTTTTTHGIPDRVFQASRNHNNYQQQQPPPQQPQQQQTTNNIQHQSRNNNHNRNMIPAITSTNTNTNNTNNNINNNNHINRNLATPPQRMPATAAISNSTATATATATRATIPAANHSNMRHNNSINMNHDNQSVSGNRNQGSTTNTTPRIVATTASGLTFIEREVKAPKFRGKILLPSNFTYTPLQLTSQPFPSQNPSPRTLEPNLLNEDLTIKLTEILERYVAGKVVLELGAKLAIPSMLALRLKAKFVYATDGNQEIVNVLPQIFGQNKIVSTRFSAQKLAFNNQDDMKAILTDSHQQFGKENVDIIVSCNPLSSQDNVAGLFHTISYFFDAFNNVQRRKFRKRKKMEQENKPSIPSIKSAFKHINSDHFHSSTPVTNGGHTPALFGPLYKKRRLDIRRTPSPQLQSSASAPLSASSTATSNGVGVGVGGNAAYSVSSNSDDESFATMLTKGSSHVQLPNNDNINVNKSNENIQQSQKRPIPSADPECINNKAMQRVCDIPELEERNFDQTKYEEWQYNNQQFNRPKRAMPKYNNNHNNQEIKHDEDEDEDMDLEFSKHGAVYSKEEAEFIKKSNADAPVFLLTQDIRGGGAPFNAFCEMCRERGYRCIQLLNKCDVWMAIVKA